MFGPPMHTIYSLFLFYHLTRADSTTVAITPTNTPSTVATAQTVPITSAPSGYNATSTTNLNASTSALTTPTALIASSCANNDYTEDAELWTSFEVMSYVTSLLSAAPTGSSNGAMLMYSDVNPPGAACTYTALCQGVQCSDLKDYTSGNGLSIQRWLGYSALINVNNYLNSIYEALMDAGAIGGLVSANIVTTFFTNPTPDASWEQIMGTITPLLGLGSAMLGPLSGGAGAILSGASAIFSMITAFGTATSIPPVADKRFDEYATITAFIGDYLEKTAQGIEIAYNNTIGTNTTLAEWNDLFTSGAWINSTAIQANQTGLLDDLIRVFTYRAINYAWVDSGVFIMYVPYGVSIKDTNGNVLPAGINQDYCQSQLKNPSNLGTLTVCDAPGGMARIFNGGTIKSGNKDLMGTSPQGWDSPFDTLPDEPFNVSGAIKGSVASWKAGDFKYDAASIYSSALTSGIPLSSDQVSSIASLKIAPETAGLFNIPVCGVYDLRFFPPTAPAVLVGNTYFSCSACGQALGGMPGSTASFWKNVNPQVQNALTSPPSCVQAYTSTDCVNGCPTDPYGPSTQAPGLGGYTPGWCGLHVTQYQRNEGPTGSDGSTSQYRLTVRIYDGQQVEITASNDTLISAPSSSYIGFSSKLPSLLEIQAGASDADPIWMRYPGQGDWQIGDQQHHCNFGKFDEGSRQGDCGFSCA